HDFVNAMYGEHTVVVRAGEVINAFHGHNKALQKDKNTSFGALGRLRQAHDGSIAVTLFENVHARVPLDYEALPACFEVGRVERRTGTIEIEISDEWPEEVATELGKIAIAYAQMTRVIYLAAMRKEGETLPDWEKDNPSDKLSTWI